MITDTKNCTKYINWINQKKYISSLILNYGSKLNWRFRQIFKHTTEEIEIGEIIGDVEKYLNIGETYNRNNWVNFKETKAINQSIKNIFKQLTGRLDVAYNIN